MKRQLALRLVLRWVMVSLAGVLIGYWVRPSFAQAPARSPQVEKIDGREVGLTVPILDFETFGAWRRGDEAWGTFTQSNQQQTSGSYAGQFAYSFPAVPANYIVFRQRANISGRPDGLRIQVYGDGSTHFLNVWVEDASGQLWQFTFGRIDHVGWQPMFAPLDLTLGWPNQGIGQAGGELVYPIRLAALVLDGHSSDFSSQGTVYVDDLVAITFADSPYFIVPSEVKKLADAERQTDTLTSQEVVTGTTETDLMAIVTVNRLNLRAGPGTTYPIVTKVLQDAALPILERDSVSGWLQVRAEGATGWISDAYVEVETVEASEKALVASPEIAATEIITTESAADVITPAVLSPTVLSATLAALVNISAPITPSAIISPTDSPAKSGITLEKPVAPLDIDSLTGRIAFSSYAGGSYAIYVMDANGENLQRVVGEASQPSLSIDGSRVAFRNWAEDERGIGVINTAGGAVRQLSNNPEDGLPAWGPDDDTLVYFSRRAGDRRSRIYQASVDNRNEWQLASVGGEYPMWMPDGRILYRATRPQIALTIIDNDGANPLTLVADGGATAPAISPDGKSILFMTLQDDNWEIYRTDVTGSEPIRLTDNASNDGLPIWSPDGQQIAFVTDRAGYWAIWVMNWDGSDAQELMVIPGTLDPRMPDEPEYRFRGWQEERIAWSR